MSAKPNLRLVWSFDESANPYPYTVWLNFDIDEQNCPDTAYITALKLYITQKNKELNITDYRIFISNGRMDVFFARPADHARFMEAYESAGPEQGTRIEMEIEPKSPYTSPPLTQPLRDLTQLSWDICGNNDITFTEDKAQGIITMTARNRDAFITFLQEWQYLQNSAFAVRLRIEAPSMHGTENLPNPIL